MKEKIFYDTKNLKGVPVNSTTNKNKKLNQIGLFQFCVNKKNKK